MHEHAYVCVHTSACVYARAHMCVCVGGGGGVCQCLHVFGPPFYGITPVPCEQVIRYERQRGIGYLIHAHGSIRSFELPILHLRWYPVCVT